MIGEARLQEAVRAEFRRLINNGEINSHCDARFKFLMEQRCWEIGTRYFQHGHSHLIVRMKNPSEFQRLTIGYVDEVVQVTFEELLKKLLSACGVSIKITPAKDASWEVTKEPANEPLRYSEPPCD